MSVKFIRRCKSEWQKFSGRSKYPVPESFLLQDCDRRNRNGLLRFGLPTLITLPHFSIVTWHINLCKNFFRTIAFVHFSSNVPNFLCHSKWLWTTLWPAPSRLARRRIKIGCRRPHTNNSNSIKKVRDPWNDRRLKSNRFNNNKLLPKADELPYLLWVLRDRTFGLRTAAAAMEQSGLGPGKTFFGCPTPHFHFFLLMGRTHDQLLTVHQ